MLNKIKCASFASDFEGIAIPTTGQVTVPGSSPFWVGIAANLKCQQTPAKEPN